jgi:hypothetical protein
MPGVRGRVTIRRGGTLTDSDHRLLAEWAADCAEHVLPLFEAVQPADARPCQAIEQARAWVRGEITMSQARTAAGQAQAAVRDLSGAGRHAAYAAGQVAVVAQCRRPRTRRSGLRNQGGTLCHARWRARTRGSAGMSVAARAATGCDPRPCAG